MQPIHTADILSNLKIEQLNQMQEASIESISKRFRKNTGISVDGCTILMLTTYRL